MDELTLLIGETGDYVLLKDAPDDEYLAYLAELGLGLPSVLSPRSKHPGLTVTEDVLADPVLLSELSRLAAQGHLLVPHGISETEERLARQAALLLAGPPARTCKRVNSKVYSRRLGEELGLRQPTGWACSDLTELEEAVAAATELLAAGHRVAFKDAFGVSGKGIVVVKDRHRLDQVHRMVVRNVMRSDSNQLSLVVEDWLDGCDDLNYQFTIGHDGSITFDFVKGAITRGGVHLGHRIPASLSRRQDATLADCALLIGSRMFAHGHFGVVGVDALIGPDEELYPIIEINARNNMSTYQARLQERFVEAGKVALAKPYQIKLTQPVKFAKLHAALGSLLFCRTAGTGFLLNSFATLNAAAPVSGLPPFPAFEGRVYGLVVARSWHQAAALDHAVATALAGLQG
ncbi:MAG TPA: hypothetical protein VIY52_16925 [Streptosporangiaceae bacterium]